MRVCPNIIIRMTEGSARIAAAPTSQPTNGCPTERNVQASASFEHTTALSWIAAQACDSAGVPGSSTVWPGPNTGCAPTVPITPAATSM